MENIIKEVEAKIANAQSDEEVLRIFAEAGIPVTREQLEAESADGELSEATLDNVSGGGVLNVLWWLWNRRRYSDGSGRGGAFSGGGGSVGGR